MAILDMGCAECGHEWEIWRQYQATLAELERDALACPVCGQQGHSRKTYPTIVHFKGGGWTPKPGTENDLRELDGVPDAVREELD